MRRAGHAYMFASGFTLIEVLIALVVVSVGLLGMTKMQALGISNTKLSSGRSLIALQANSLASAMHGNRSYWASGVAPAIITMSAAGVTDSTGVLNATTGGACTKPCTPAQLAAHDVQAWAVNMAQQFPTYVATLKCATNVGAPISCTVNITWAEKTVAYNALTATGATTQLSTQAYTQYIEP